MAEIDGKRILDRLFSLHRFGIKPGLDRTQSLLEYLGNPQEKFKTIHIAGTNGKGSVSSMIASVFMESGYKTGLYTSPHILRFNERIKINGIEIQDSYIESLCSGLLDEAAKHSCTFFEVTTALTLRFFADNDVEIAVIEAGMGGKSDSTNILQPVLSVITQVGIDHTEYLGSTIEEIAMEKAGIIKFSTPAVIQENNPALKTIFTDMANRQNAPVTFVMDNYTIQNCIFYDDLTMMPEIRRRTGQVFELRLPFAGRHQCRNVITVLSVFDIIGHEFSIKEENLIAGFKNAKRNSRLRGRIELLRQTPPLVIDVAHNPSGIAALTDTLSECFALGQKWNIVFSAMSDKNISGMLEMLRTICAKLHVVQLETGRAAKTENIFTAAKELKIEAGKCGASEAVIPYILSINEPLLIAGSFYLIEEFLKISEKYLSCKSF